MYLFRSIWLLAFAGFVTSVTARHQPSSFGTDSDIPPYKELYFDQLLDHFNYNSFDQQTFKQRYLVCSTFWKPDEGPIFFYTGNEGSITNFYDNTGFLFDIAPQFGALIIFAEHRFYGQSLPAGLIKSFKKPYLGLLTIEQALADYAVLLDTLKVELNFTDAPIIAFGGSYGGMLAAYMRLKYPNIIDGALAASSPVLSIADMGDNRTFFKQLPLKPCLPHVHPANPTGAKSTQ